MPEGLGTAVFLLRTLTKRGGVYLGQKVPASDAKYVLSTVDVLIIQVSYFSYPAPWPDKNTPQQHWGPSSVSAQALESLHLNNCSQYDY